MEWLKQNDHNCRCSTRLEARCKVYQSKESWGFEDCPHLCPQQVRIRVYQDERWESTIGSPILLTAQNPGWAISRLRRIKIKCFLFLQWYCWGSACKPNISVKVQIPDCCLKGMLVPRASPCQDSRMVHIPQDLAQANSL